MNDRQAKRVACARIAAQVLNDINSGGVESDPAVKTPEDALRVYNALDELRAELLRRAGSEA